MHALDIVIIGWVRWGVGDGGEPMGVMKRLSMGVMIGLGEEEVESAKWEIATGNESVGLGVDWDEDSGNQVEYWKFWMQYGWHTGLEEELDLGAREGAKKRDL